MKDQVRVLFSCRDTHSQLLEHVVPACYVRLVSDRQPSSSHYVQALLSSIIFKRPSFQMKQEVKVI